VERRLLQFFADALGEELRAALVGPTQSAIPS
jgi:hypothetical protein